MWKIVFCGVAVFVLVSCCAYAGEVKLTTYYPAPYGEYKRIITKTLGVGDNDDNGTINASDAPNPDTNPGDVWIKGDITMGSNRGIHLDTSDGADTGALQLSGGGGYGLDRGAILSLFGNEVPGAQGRAELLANGPLVLSGPGKFIHINNNGIGVNTNNPEGVGNGSLTIDHGNIIVNKGYGIYTAQIESNPFSPGGPLNICGGTQLGVDHGGMISLYSSDDPGSPSSVKITAGTVNNGYINMSTGGADRVRILNNGNVGIGTLTPAGTLDVRGGTAAANTNGTSLNLYSQNGGTGNTNGGDIILMPGSASGTGKSGNVGIGTTAPGAKLEVRGWTNLIGGCTLTNSTAQYNSHFPYTDNNAYVTGAKIYLRGGAPQGWRAPVVIDNATSAVTVNGEFRAYNGDYYLVFQGDGNLVIYTSGGRDVWSTMTGPIPPGWSSIRWKENIHPIENALEKVSKLRGVTFDWKEGHTNSFTGNKKGLGLIAEDVGKVFPEIVSYEKDNSGYATALDYDKLTTVLVEAVKELKNRNMELENKNMELNKRVKLLEDKLNR